MSAQKKSSVRLSTITPAASVLQPKSGGVQVKKTKIKDIATGIVIPESTERCIIFPFDRKRLRYYRDTYQKQWIAKRCTPETIVSVIAEIESACGNFRRHKFYKCLILMNVVIGMLVILTSMGLMLGAQIKMAVKGTSIDSSEVYSKSGQHKLTMVGILMFSFTVLVMYMGIIIVGCLSGNISGFYISKFDHVLAERRKEFEKVGMRWKIGTKRLWLELWLDEYDAHEEVNKDEIVDAGRASVHHKMADHQEQDGKEGSQINRPRGVRGSMRNSILDGFGRPRPSQTTMQHFEIEGRAPSRSSTRSLIESSSRASYMKNRSHADKS